MSDTGPVSGTGSRTGPWSDTVELPAGSPVDTVVPGYEQPELRGAPAGPPAGGPPAGWWGRLRSHLAEPFSRNAYALLLNTGLTGLLGIGFWLLAARYYADADVGRGSALISTMTLLSGVVAINLTGTLSRFIPQTGRWTRRLVLYCYGLSALVVAVLAAGFVLTLGYWGASFDPLRDPATGLWFVAAVVAASLFTIQDGVLVGLRSATWVPVENTLFGIAKIILLVLFAAAFPHNGVYLSWVIPMALLVLPINGLIFGRLIPRHVRVTGENFLPPSPAGIGRFFAADYLGALFVFGAVYLVPVMVAASVQPVTFAYFYVAWMMGGILNLTAMNLAHSLTVEGVYEMDTLVRNCRAALRRAVGLLMVAAVAVALAAPYCLVILGRGYLDAVPLLQILAFAALPRAVVEIWIGVLRAQNRPREIARVQIASGALVIGSVLTWLQVVRFVPGLAQWQITGVGVVVLAGQTLVALVVLPGLWGFLTSVPPAPGAPAGTPSPGPARTGGSARRRIPAGWTALGGVAGLTVAATALYLVPLRGTDLGAMTGYGLISVLPVASLAGLALLTLAFMSTLALRRPYRVVLGAQLAILVGCLHGVTALVEPLPRFAITWVHLGFVEYIGRTGTTAPALDGRFSWPGFFALVAFLTDSARWQDLLTFLKLTPLLSNLLYLLAFALLLRNLRASWRATWFAAWLFCVLNWVGQDYFSPQGFGYWLYLVFLAILVTWFRPAPTSTPAPDPGRRGPAAWLRPAGGLRSGELPVEPAGHAVRVALLLLLLGIFVVATASHQLTPFLMVGACAGLVLVRRCVATGLPMLLVVILAAWISYLSVGYWSGHMADLLGGVGDLTGNVASSVGQRASAGDVEHQRVVAVRIALTVALFLVAGLGMLRRRLRGLDDRVAVVLLAAPFLALGLQSYGGEITLRVYLFALPAACVLAAYAFFPESQSGHVLPQRILAAGAAALVLVGAFFPARYGNEKYEMMRPGELAAVEFVYQQGGPSRILFLTDQDDSGATPFIPLGYQDMERVDYTSMQAAPDPADIGAVLDRMRELGPGTYLVTTRSQEAYLELGGGYPAGWGQRFRARMAASPQVRVVEQNPDATVYTLSTPPLPASPREPGPPTGVNIGSTPWTPVGVVFAALLLGVLTGRELWRVRLGPGEHRRLRPLTLAAIPLLAGLVLVILQRLILLTNW